LEEVELTGIDKGSKGTPMTNENQITTATMRNLVEAANMIGNGIDEDMTEGLRTVAKFYTMPLGLQVEFRFDPSKPKEVISVSGGTSRKVPTELVLGWIASYKHIDDMTRTELNGDKSHYAVPDMDHGHSPEFVIGPYWSKLFLNRQGKTSIKHTFPDVYVYPHWLKRIRELLTVKRLP
jgi:hypothetical protein